MTSRYAKQIKKRTAMLARRRIGSRRRVNGVSVLIGDDHPMAEMRNASGYIKRSRLVLAEKIGRPLRSEEVCHHRNGNVMDDRKENLKLFGSNGEHTKYHAQVRKAIV